MLSRELRSGPSEPAGGVDGVRREMQQVRDLLFGEAQRHLEQRLQHLEHELGVISGRLQSVESYAHATASAQRVTLAELGKVVVALGEHMQKIAATEVAEGAVGADVPFPQ